MALRGIARKGRPEELEAIRAMYDVCTAELEGLPYLPNGVTGVFPGTEMIREALEAGRLYVVEVSGEDEPRGSLAFFGAEEHNSASVLRRGELVGGLIANHEGDEEYALIPWKCPAPENEILVLHAMRMRKVCQGCGFAKALIALAIEDARARGMKALRLDTLEDHPTAIHIYSSAGFEERMRMRMHYGDIGDVNAVMFEMVL